MASLHKTTKAGLSVWCDGQLQDGVEIRFEKDGPNTHIANVFDSLEKAQLFHYKLRSCSHPNVQHFSEIIEVINDTYVVAFDKRGKKSLKDLLTPQKKSTFFDGIWLTELTKDLLVDSFSVIRSFATEGVIVSLDPEKLFLVCGRVMFTKFWLSEEVLGTSEYGKVGDLISGMLKALETTNPDMTKLLNKFDNLDQSLPVLCKMPIFWSEEDRIHFPNDVCDFLECGRPAFLIKNGESPFQKTLDDIYGDELLSKWAKAIKLERKVQKWGDQRRERHVLTRKADSQEEDGARDILRFISICFARFESYSHLKCTEKDLAQGFERLFEGYVWKLYEAALDYEKTYTPAKLLPVEARLGNLVSSR